MVTYRDVLDEQRGEHKMASQHDYALVVFALRTLDNKSKIEIMHNEQPGFFMLDDSIHIQERDFRRVFAVGYQTFYTTRWTPEMTKSGIEIAVDAMIEQMMHIRGERDKKVFSNQPIYEKRN